MSTHHQSEQVLGPTETAPPPTLANGGAIDQTTAPARQVSESLAKRLQGLDGALSSTMPTKRRRSRSSLFAILAGVVLLALAAGAGFYVFVGTSDPYAYLELIPASRGDVVLSVVEKGELEAARNADIVCEVRSSGRGIAAATTIKWIIDDGSRVKAGDLLVLLDSSALEEQRVTQEGTVSEKEASLLQAREELEIVKSQNEIDLAIAQNTVEMAQIELEKYIEGDYQQKRKDILGRYIQQADRVMHQRRMQKKGYLSQAQLQSDELKLESIKEEKRVLDYEYRQRKLELEMKLKEAIGGLKVVRIQNAAKLAQAEAKLKAAEAVLRTERKKLQDLEKDIENCRIVAPNDGMVVYYVEERSRWNMGSSSSLIAVGEPVREGQKLMRIPDLSQMQVKVNVHETLVPRVRADKTRRVKTGFTDRLTALQAVARFDAPHLFTLLAQPQITPWFRDKDEKEEIIEYGLPAKVRVASLEKPLRGHVKYVSSVSSKTSWLTSDVKVYQTIVGIDDKVEGLKPGMTAEVTIALEELKNVLRLPVHAVLEAGGVKFCYVKPDTGPPEKRILDVGLNNNRFVEIKPSSQLAEGELVVNNPRPLAEERGDLKAEYDDPGAGLMDSAQAKSPGDRAGTGKVKTSPPAAQKRSGPPQKRGPRVGRPSKRGGADKRGGRPSGMSREERQRRGRAMLERFKKATPEQRKKMLEAIPEQFRKMAKQRLKEQGIDIPD